MRAENKIERTWSLAANGKKNKYDDLPRRSEGRAQNTKEGRRSNVEAKTRNTKRKKAKHTILRYENQPIHVYPHRSPSDPFQQSLRPLYDVRLAVNPLCTRCWRCNDEVDCSFVICSSLNDWWVEEREGVAVERSRLYQRKRVHGECSGAGW